MTSFKTLASMQSNVPYSLIVCAALGGLREARASARFYDSPSGLIEQRD